MDRLSNRLGALALALMDEQARRMQAASGLGPSAAAALVTLGEYPGEPVAALASVLGLSHSATVRLVDDLERRGLLARGAGSDRRSVALRLTDRGLTLRAETMGARADVLADVLSDLQGDERRVLEEAVSRMLRRLTTDRRTADHICRLCNEVACDLDDCPVERRALELGAR